MFQLASCSDVLIENYLPKKLASKGLGYEQLAESHPHLIYCSISGYFLAVCMQLCMWVYRSVGQSIVKVSSHSLKLSKDKLPLSYVK